VSSREEFLRKLSPDLRAVFDRAEKMLEESLFQRALALFQKLETYLPNEEFLVEEIDDCRRRVLQSSGPAAGQVGATSHGSESASALMEGLARDLGIHGDAIERAEKIPEISEILDSMNTGHEMNAALDLSIFAGVSENWQVALEATNKRIAAGECPEDLYVWKLCCLVHLESFAEAVALFSSRHWSSKILIHVNFLAGLAYEGLGVRDQAKSRFTAVFNQNSRYRKVAQKLLNY